MKKKNKAALLKKTILLPLVMFILLLGACDESLAITQIEIGVLPIKTIYYIGVDSELDFGEGTILMHTKGAGIFEYDIKDNHYLDISSTVDFNIEGTYEVLIEWVGDEVYRYQVQVTSQE